MSQEHPDGAGPSPERPVPPAVSPRAKLLNLSSVAFVFPVAIALSVYVGHTLDERVGTFPWLTIVSFFVGIAAGFLSLFRVIRVFDKKNGS